MKIGFIGLGKLGLPCSLAIEQKGHTVFGIDPSEMTRKIIDTKKLTYIEENAQPALDVSQIKLVDMKYIVCEADTIFVAVQTPHDPRYEGVTPIDDNRADFDYTFLCNAIQLLCNELKNHEIKKDVVIISTVLPGTMEKYIRPIIEPVKDKFNLIYNPFFIAMGTTMWDFLNPEFILLGADDPQAADRVKQFYATLHNKPVFETTIENAELTKVLYNTFIGMKIVFANTVMELCHKTSKTNCDEIISALSLANERLISSKYLRGGMGDGGGCLLPNEIVFSEHGPIKIKDLKENDQIYSSDGKLHTVIDTYKRPYKGKCLKVKARGLPYTQCTLDHKFIVVKDMRKKYSTNGKIKTINNQPFEKYITEPHEIYGYDLTKDHYVMFPVPQDCSLENPIHATDDYVVIAGYYLSEGSLCGRSIDKPKRIQFSMHQKEQEYLSEIEKHINQIYPNSYFSRTRKEDNLGENLRFCQSDLSRLLLNDFGTKCDSKKIPNWILFGKKENAINLLRGLWRGDGSTNTEGFNYTTTSIDLAYGVYFLLHKCNIISTIKYHPSRVGSDLIEHRESWEVCIRNAVYIEALANLVEMPIKHQMQKKRYPNYIPLLNNMSYHKIDSIELVDYEGTVWNMNVDQTHQYVCSMGIQPNCHPRDNIALSWLSKKLNLSHDFFEDIMIARQNQTKWMIDLIKSEMKDLPLILMGWSFKPNTNIVVGSPARLLSHYLHDEAISHEVYDPIAMLDTPKTRPAEPALFFISTQHDLWKTFEFPSGSTVIDPFRYLHDNKTITKYIPVGKSL